MQGARRNTAFALPHVVINGANHMSEISNIKNVQDLGYRFASHEDLVNEFVAYAKEHIPGFPDKTKIPEEVVTGFKAGALVRYTELYETKHYMRDGEDTYIECSAEDCAAANETGF